MSWFSTSLSIVALAAPDRHGVQCRVPRDEVQAVVAEVLCRKEQPFTVRGFADFMDGLRRSVRTQRRGLAARGGDTIDTRGDIGVVPFVERGDKVDARHRRG